MTELWDPERWASPRMVARAGLDPGEIAWDVIALYPATVGWAEPFPAPTWYDGPVVQALEPVERFLGEHER